MKHIVLSLIFLNYLATHSFAQDDNVIHDHYFEFDDNQTVKEVLDLVSEQYDVLLAYPTPLLKNLVLTPTSYSFSDVEDLLNKILSDFHVDVRQVSGAKYLIRKSLLEPGTIEERDYSGIVKDAESGDVLPFASVYLNDFSNGTFTDSNGKFTLSSRTASDDTIIVSYLAYEEMILYAEDFKTPVEVKLIRNENTIENVLVEYIVPPTMFSRDGMAIIFSEEMPDGQNIVSNDLMRQLQLLPGINAYNDDESSLKIRGSNADQSRIILDAMPLYNVDHYYGIFSSVNSDYVKEVSLYKNAQPIQYHASGGGLLLMDSGSSSSGTNALIRADLLNTTAAITSELNENFSLNLGLRTTYRNVDDGGLINLKRRSNDPENFDNPQTNVFISNEPDFRFYDLNGRLNFKLSDRTSLSYSLFKSHDRYINSYDLNFSNQHQQNSKTVFENNEEWDNFSNAFIIDSRLNKHWSLTGTFHLTSYNQESNLQSELIQNNQGQIERRTIENVNKSSIEDYGLNLFASSDFANHNIIVGTAFNKYNTHNLLESEQQVIINQDLDAELYDLYMAYTLTEGPFTFQIGNRGHYYNRNNHNSVRFSPQLSASFLKNESSTFKFSVSRSHQFLRELEYETRQSYTVQLYTVSNKDIPVLRTDNFMLGYSYQQSRWGFDIEAYFKNIKGVLQLTNIRPGILQPDQGMQDFKLFKGDRNVIGLDFMLNYTNRTYTGWLAYTLSKSTDEFKAIFKGESFSSEDDRRHQLKLINSIALGPFTLSNNTIYASGKKYLSLESLLDNPQDRFQIDPDKHIKSLPAYFRIDLGLDYNFLIAGKETSFGISVFNVLNRQNVKYLQYAYRLDGQNANSTILGSEAELLDRTVNLNFSIKF